MPTSSPTSPPRQANAPAPQDDAARENSRAFDQFEAALTRKLNRRRSRRKPTARGVPPHDRAPPPRLAAATAS
jgi:hypothetical protein